MPKVRARKDMFHGGQRRRRGDVFDITDGQLAEAKKRYVERHINPAFELIPTAKPAPADTSEIA